MGLADVINVKYAPYYAKGDGVHDDTLAIQAALNVVSGQSNLSTATIFFPAGVYKITNTLTYVGNVSNGPLIRGNEIGRGPTGVRIIWAGPAGGTMFEMRGATSTTVENITFEGGVFNPSPPRFCVHVRSDVANGGTGSSQVTFRGCQFTEARNSGIITDSTLLAIGDNPADGYQCDNVTVENCLFSAYEDGYTDACWRTYDQANCKVHIIRNCLFDGGNYHIDWQHASGNLYITDKCNSGNVFKAAIRVGDGNLHVESMEIENSSAFGGMFIDSAGTSSDASVIVTNCHIIMDTSARATPGEFMRFAAGRIVLIGNMFDCNTAGGPKIYIADAHDDDSNAFVGSFTSIGNFYRFASGNIQIFDGSNNPQLGSDYANSNRLNVVSINDNGGDQSINTAAALKSTMGVAPRIGGIAPFLTSGFVTPGITARRVAEPRVTTTEFVIPHAVFVANGARIAPCQIQAGTKVRTVIAKVTTAFAAPSGTITLKVGYDDASTEQNYLVPFDATVATTYGLVDGDLGSELARASLVQGGGLATWTQHYLVVNMGGSANPALLTNGSVTIYLTTEVLIS